MLTIIHPNFLGKQHYCPVCFQYFGFMGTAILLYFILMKSLNVHFDMRLDVCEILINYW